MEMWMDGYVDGCGVTEWMNRGGTHGWTEKGTDGHRGDGGVAGWAESGVDGPMYEKVFEW